MRICLRIQDSFWSWCAKCGPQPYLIFQKSLGTECIAEQRKFCRRETEATFCTPADDLVLHTQQLTAHYGNLRIEILQRVYENFSLLVERRV